MRTTNLAARGLPSALLLAAALTGGCSSEQDRPTVPNVAVTPEVLDVGGPGWAMALAHRSLWIQVDPPIDAISRLDLETGRAKPMVPGGHFARFGAEGLWVVGEDWLALIDPRTGKKLRQVALDGNIALGAGAVWVYNSEGLHRVDPADESVAAPIATDAPGLCQDPAGLLVAFDSAWVACKEGKVVRMDLKGAAESVAIETDLGSHTLAAGDDAVWVANYEAGTVSRIHSTTQEVTTVPEAGVGVGIAVGGGSVWTSSFSGIVEIDPRSAAVVRKLDLGSAYGDNLYELIWDRGALWASTRSSEVLKIRPPT